MVKVLETSFRGPLLTKVIRLAWIHLHAGSVCLAPCHRDAYFCLNRTDRSQIHRGTYVLVHQQFTVNTVRSTS